MLIPHLKLKLPLLGREPCREWDLHQHRKTIWKRSPPLSMSLLRQARSSTDGSRGSGQHRSVSRPWKSLKTDAYQVVTLLAHESTRSNTRRPGVATISSCLVWSPGLDAAGLDKPLLAALGQGRTKQEGNSGNLAVGWNERGSGGCH